MNKFVKIAIYLFTTKISANRIDQVLQILVDQGEMAPAEKSKVERHIDRLAAAS